MTEEINGEYKKAAGDFPDRDKVFCLQRQDGQALGKRFF